jgi:tRNA uridine 5-carboxymethylaminomethyl modification enzyme
VFSDTINYSKIQEEPGTNEKLSFEHYKQTYLSYDKQTPCYLTYTNKKTHDIIKKNLSKSAMYSGNIKGVGPRYCPSIEDKVVRFSDKPRHQLFIEPESKYLPTMYLQGLSTSMPEGVQLKFIKTIAGLENVKVQRYGYAIEYDAINPTQLYPTLELKKIKNLYFAGQVNGTSGYEEAAGQGLIAGINASLNIRKKKQLILKRNESYIGVMIDDITTKGITDPYRLLTSRAEYRLLLRNDNSDDRLIKYGYYANTIKKVRYNDYIKQKNNIEKIIKYLKTHSLSSSLIKKYGNSSHNLYDLLKRPEVSLKEILTKKTYSILNDQSINKLEIKVKFDGYIKNQEKNVEKYKKLDNIDLSHIKDYKNVSHLSLEAIDKLNKIKPQTLSIAQRIQGITASDIIAIKAYCES